MPHASALPLGRNGATINLMGGSWGLWVAAGVAAIVVGVAVIGGGYFWFDGNVVAQTSQCNVSQPATEVDVSASTPGSLETFKPIFVAAAARFDLGAEGPAYLAAINRVESDFDAPATGVQSGDNGLGAAGPMQIGIGGAAGDEWDTVKVSVPGGPNPPSVYDETDAVYAAADYLQRSGAPGDWPAAIFSYNHATWYVSEVESYEEQYLPALGAGSTSEFASTRVSAVTTSSAAGATSTPNLVTDTGGVVAATVYGTARDTRQRGAYAGPTLAADYEHEKPPFAELGGSTSATAGLLGHLPAGTAVQITNPVNGDSIVAYKEDFGSGQGTATLDGHRYRIALWWQTAKALGITRPALLKISLQQTSASTAAASATAATVDCASLDAMTGASSGTLGQQIVAYAERFAGLPYVYAAEDPPSGYPAAPDPGGTTPSFDCSGLVQYVYWHFGIHLPRDSEDQSKAGIEFTNAGQLQPGDLIFSNWPGDNAPPGHVAIYAGNGETFEASETGEPLHKVRFDAAYQQHVLWYTRVTQLATGVSAA